MRGDLRAEAEVEQERSGAGIFGQLGQPLEDLAAELLGVLLLLAAGECFGAKLRFAALSVDWRFHQCREAPGRVEMPKWALLDSNQ